MCYFVSIAVNFKIIETRFGYKFMQSESFQPVYSASAFTFPSLPAITNENPKQIVSLQWGLIPFWVKDYEQAIAIRPQTLNARAETIFEKPAFRHAITSQRCLILIDGFFEYRHENKKTYPYYIKLKNHQPFALAGIWDSWKNPMSGEILRTFAVITTKANPLLEKIHNTKKRMPVILPGEKERYWLENTLDKSAIQSLLIPFDEKQMEAYPVSKNINQLGFNIKNPAALHQVEYPELPALL